MFNIRGCFHGAKETVYYLEKGRAQTINKVRDKWGPVVSSVGSWGFRAPEFGCTSDKCAQGERTVNASDLRRMRSTQNPGCVESLKDSEGSRRGRCTQPASVCIPGVEWVCQIQSYREQMQRAGRVNPGLDCLNHMNLYFIGSATVATGGIAQPEFWRAGS